MTIHTKHYETAGITIRLNSDFPISENTFHSKFKLFETDHPGTDKIIINHHFSLPAELQSEMDNEQPIYEKDHWLIFKSDSSWIYKYTPLLPGDPGCLSIAKFNADHTKADIYAPDLSEKQYQNANFGALTLFNTDQVLFAKLLCDRSGFIMHSNGFVIEQDGILMAGHSGAGKSTLSAMLKKKGYDPLCDDRMFITLKNDNFFIHGNWCHGTVANVAHLSAPLKAVFFLEQSKQNKAIPITEPTQKSHHILKSLVKPFFSPGEWNHTFLLVSKLIEKVDCYTLEFDLSGIVFDTILETLSEKEL